MITVCFKQNHIEIPTNGITVVSGVGLSLNPVIAAPKNMGYEKYSLAPNSYIMEKELGFSIWLGFEKYHTHKDEQILYVLPFPETAMHPAEIVKIGAAIVEKSKQDNVHFLVFTNHPDLVQALKYIPNKQKTPPTQFYLYDKELKNYGGDIDEIFKFFNESLDLLAQLGKDD